MEATGFNKFRGSLVRLAISVVCFLVMAEGIVFLLLGLPLALIHHSNIAGLFVEEIKGAILPGIIMIIAAYLQNVVSVSENYIAGPSNYMLRRDVTFPIRGAHVAGNNKFTRVLFGDVIISGKNEKIRILGLNNSNRDRLCQLIDSGNNPPS